MALDLIKFSIFDIATKTVVRTGYGVVHMDNVELQCGEGEDWVLGWWEPGQKIKKINNVMEPVGLDPAAPTTDG